MACVKDVAGNLFKEKRFSFDAIVGMVLLNGKALDLFVTSSIYYCNLEKNLFTQLLPIFSKIFINVFIIACLVV